MRKIDQDQLPRFKDLAPIRAVAARLQQTAARRRSAFIDAEDAACSALRAALWTIAGAKCWYSEASLQEGEGHVEHFRPKKRLWGTTHAGYWWRAFDWRNLRLAHPTVNKRMTDFVTGRKAGKGSYFPLEAEAQRATVPAEEGRERPTLLDPIRASDGQMLAFNFDSGAPEPRYKPERNAWLHRRAAESIDYYHLDEATWNKKRYDLMREVAAICDRIEEAAVAVPRDDDAYNGLIDELAGYMGPFSEFSSACIQVVQERGLLNHIASGGT